MTGQQPTPDREHTAMKSLPRWEGHRRHRRLLDQRVRVVRRYLLAGGVVGTAAFAGLAGYSTKGSTTASAPSAPATEAATSQVIATDFFADQANIRLASVSTAALPVATAADFGDGESHHSTKVDDGDEESHHSAKSDDDEEKHHSATTNTVSAVPMSQTATTTPAALNVTAPSNPMPAQTHSRTHASN